MSGASSSRRALCAPHSRAFIGWVAALALTIPSPAPAAPRFTAPFLAFSTGAANPQKVVAADFDEDSISDLVISHSGGSPVVTVVIGNGDGTFGPPTTWLTGASSVGIAAADLNGDGHSDIAVGHNSPAAVAVRLGIGDGTFGPETDYSLGDGFDPVDIVIQDVSGDGRLDLAVACSGGSGSIAILRGNGDGTFGAAVGYAAGGSLPTCVAVGLLNGDTAPDIAVGYGNLGSSVSVLFNAGDGTFGAPTTIAMGTMPHSVAIADLSGDGRGDLVSTNQGADKVSVRLGNGDGTFQRKTDYTASVSPTWVAISNLDADGRPDLIVANESSSYSVSVFLGTGGGGFAARADFHAGNRPIYVTATELNGDGRTDLAVVDGNANACSVLLGNGDGTFGGYHEVPANAGGQAIALGDLNGDGRLDVAEATAATEARLSVFLSTGGGGFGPPTSYNVGSPATSVAVEDLNADGRRDVVVTAENLVKVLLGTGDGYLGSPVSYTAGTTPAWVAIGDVNQDNRPDLVVANQGSNDISVRLGAGDGSFGAQTTYATGASPVHVALADFNADGRLDVVTANNGSSDFSVRLGSGGGIFGAKADYAAGGPFPKSISIGRVDSNASLDIALGRDFGGAVSTFLNNGSGVFTISGGVGGNSGKSVNLVDVNADGWNDLVSANQLLFGVTVSLGHGDGVFDPEVVYGAGRSGAGISLATGDLNEDGRPDIVVAPFYGGITTGEVLSILLNRGSSAPVVSAPVSVNAEEGGTLSFAVSAADLDGDPITSLTANLSGLPAGHDAVFTPNMTNTGGTLTWHPKSAMAGSYNVTFTAANAQTSAIETTRIDVAAAGATIEGTLLWTPSAGMTGTFDILYTATDQFGDTTYAVTHVTVTGGGGVASPTFAPAPRPVRQAISSPMKGPVIRAISSTTTSTGSTLILDTSATGATTLSASTSGLPAGNTATYTTDTQPSVAAPITVSAEPGEQVVITIAVSDPDGNAITSLTADLSSLPSGNAAFTPDGTNTAGTFTWTPALADTGIFGVTFIATNEMVTTQPAVITVGKGLAAYWKLNGDGNDGAKGNTLTLLGGVTYTTGRLNQGADVNGSPPSRLEATALHDYDLRPAGFTAEGWIKTRSPSFASDLYIARADSANEAWEMYVCGATCPLGKVVARVVNSTATTALQSAGSVNDGLFHHVAMTYDGATLKLYIDGVLDNSVSASGLQARVGGGKIALGNKPAGTNAFDGIIDDFRIWKRSKTGSQIAGAMGAELGFPTGVVETAGPGVSFALFQNRPNPFNPSTIIRFDLPRAGRARLNVYDVGGRLVARLLDRDLPAGTHSIGWSGRGIGGRDAASGVYFYKLDAAGLTSTRRMMLLR